MRREKKTSFSLLVIEPDEATRSGMKRLFEMNGYRVTAVSDETEASIASRLARFDLILFDADLPPPESFAAAERLHRRAELKDTPLLVLSVNERIDASADSPEVDKFTVAYRTNLSRFDELEKLIDCLITVKI